MSGVVMPDAGWKSLDPSAFNAEAESEFVEIVRGLLAESARVRSSEVVQEAAFRLNVSPETAKRYLFKWSARSAPFVVSGGWVALRGKGVRS